MDIQPGGFSSENNKWEQIYAAAEHRMEDALQTFLQGHPPAVIEYWKKLAADLVGGQGRSLRTKPVVRIRQGHIPAMA